MPERQIHYEIDIDTSGAVRELRRMGQESKRAARELGDAFEDSASAGDKARQAIIEVATAADRELRESAAAAEALAQALGPELTARANVDELVADLNRMGVSFEDIRGEADQFAATLRQVDGVRLQQVNDGLDTTKTRMGEVRDSSDQTRSVMANMAGNVAQDLGAVGGVAGSLGVGLGQLAEYATEGNISLAQLGKLAGPLAGLTALGFGVQTVTKGLADLRAAQDAYTQQQVDFNTAVDESGSVVETLNEMLADNQTLLSRPELNWWQSLLNDVPFVGRAIDEVAVATTGLVGAMGDAGITAEQWVEAIRVDVPGGIDRFLALTKQIDAALASGKITTEQFDLLNEQLGLYGSLTAGAAAGTDVFVTSVTGMSKAIQTSRQEARDTEAAWKTLIELQETGGIRTQEAADAWNVLRDNLQLSNDELAEMFRQRYDEHLAAQAEAAQAAAQAFADYRNVLSSSEWDAAAFTAGTTAIEGFFDTVLGRQRVLADTEEAFDGVAAAVDEAGTVLIDLTTGEGRNTFQALEELGAAVVPEIAKAFADADGDLEQFQRNMDDVGQRTITGLMASFMDLGDSEQEARDKANTLMIELGLIPSEVETIYNLAGIEEAKLKLDLLSGSIDALPDNVRTTVTQQIIEGDYVGALNTIQAYYDRHPAEVTVDANIDKALEAIRRLQTIARLANIVVSVGSQSRSASAGAPATGSVGVARTATATTSGGGGGGVALAAAPPVIRNYHVTVQAAVVGNRYDVQRAVTRALRNAERLGAA